MLARNLLQGGCLSARLLAQLRQFRLQCAVLGK